MDQIYSSIINFYNEQQQLDYQKTKKLVEHNLENGQKQFYLKTVDFNFSKLNCQDQKSYYQQLLSLIPAESKLLIEADFSSFAQIKTIIADLNRFPKQFELVIKLPFLVETNTASYLKEYIGYLNYLNKNSDFNFYINLDNRLLNLIESHKLFKASLGFSQLQGFVIDPVYFYDLDLKKLKLLKEKYKKQFKFLIFADDFYYLNLDLGLKTISKYFNLFPAFFKNMFLAFKNNSLELAKEQQLILNDLIEVVKNSGGSAAFKYLLAKTIGFEFEPVNSLSEADKMNLDLEINKINEYIVDKV